jgi:alpha-tubulin suppressor-like RCC1 family protein
MGKEVIISISSGQNFTLWVTQSGDLWCQGKLFLDLLDQSSEEPTLVKLPENMICRRVWTSRSEENILLVLAELKDKTTGKKFIYSAGESSDGLLGQGDDVLLSNEFKKIHYESEDLVF